MTSLATGSDFKIPASFSFSQSSLQDYADCPRRFQLRYLQQLTWPAAETEPVEEYEIRQQEGLHFHRMVQQHILGVPAEALGKMAMSPDLRRWWQNYLASDLGLGSHTLHTELSLSTPLGDHRLSAKYDLVAVRDGQARILDWKTYARRPREEQIAARWQTRVYRFLLAVGGAALNQGRAFSPDDIEMVYWFAEFPDQPIRLRYDTGQLHRDRSALEAIANEILSGRSFPVTDELTMCRFCVYRSYCDRGRKAGDWVEAEAVAEGEVSFDLDFEQISEIEY